MPDGAGSVIASFFAEVRVPNRAND